MMWWMKSRWQAGKGCQNKVASGDEEASGHEMRRRQDMTESPSTGSGGGSLPSFVLTAFLYIERSCDRIIL